MCRNCGDDEELADCAYDAEEFHPKQWSGRRDDYPDELPEPTAWHDDSGKPYDNNYRRYNPYQGSQSPTDGRCNAVLDNWEKRYGEPRYCMRLPRKAFDCDDPSDFCHVHRGHEQLMERAKELFTHGLFSKSIKHVFEYLTPWQQLSVLGWYDSYVEESHYDFDETYEEHSIDFSEYDDDLPLEIESMLDDGTLSIFVPIPQSHENRAYALYRAAVMDMKSGLAERAILSMQDGERAMERETVVSVTDDGQKITDLEEHHLNLPLSRLDKDRKELLAFGGVSVDGDGADVNVNVGDPDSLVMDLDESETSNNPVEDDMAE